MAYYGGESNVPGAAGNLLAGGFSLRDLFPNAQSDIPTRTKSPYIKPGTKPSLKELFPPRPGTFGADPTDSFDRRIPVANTAFLNVPAAGVNAEDFLAGGFNHVIQKGPGALGGRSEEQIRRLQQNIPENQQLLEEFKRRGITPGGGPQLPLAGMSNLNNAVANMTLGAPGNLAGFYGGPQIGQAPVGFAAKTIYS